VQSWYLDLTLLAGYVGGERRYHHTAPISSILALAEGLRLVDEEGMEARAERHRVAAAALLEGLEPLGFQPFVAAPHRLPMLSSLCLPERVVSMGEAGLRRQLLDKYGVEVGGGLGPLAGRIWRIGLMGENARIASVERLLCALRREIGEG
jgi:alanine-glyoxylate transaminase/serine-glyoxylate transaminase/serine-pyruvate transaminase